METRDGGHGSAHGSVAPRPPRGARRPRRTAAGTAPACLLPCASGAHRLRAANSPEPEAGSAPLTLRTGVRYSATSSAFPFTVLITFCILGPEERPAPRRAAESRRVRSWASPRPPPTAESETPGRRRPRDWTRRDGTNGPRRRGPPPPDRDTGPGASGCS